MKMIQYKKFRYKQKLEEIEIKKSKNIEINIYVSEYLDLSYKIAFFFKINF